MRTDTDNLEMVNLKVDSDLKKVFKEMCRQNRIPMSVVIERMMSQYVENDISVRISVLST